MMNEVRTVNFQSALMRGKDMGRILENNNSSVGNLPEIMYYLKVANEA